MTETLPSDEIRSLIQKECPNMSSVLYVNNGEKVWSTEETNELKGMTGKKRWVVVYDKEQRLRDVENKLTELTKSHKKLEGVTRDLCRSKIRNLVSNMLLFLEGSQPDDKGESTRFKFLKPEAKSRVRKFVDEIGFEFERFRQDSDNLINERNHGLHSRDVTLLGERVKEALGWLTDYPEWRNNMRFECVLLDNWDILIKHFPEDDEEYNRWVYHVHEDGDGEMIRRTTEDGEFIDISIDKLTPMDEYEKVVPEAGKKYVAVLEDGDRLDVEFLSDLICRGEDGNYYEYVEEESGAQYLVPDTSDDMEGIPVDYFVMLAM